MRRALMGSAVCALLLTLGSPASAQVSIGVQIGQPPPPRAYYVPARPTPEFVWVEGYWYPQGRRYVWHNGYWTRPPFVGAYWVEPYHYGGRYFAGYWESGSRRAGHDHRWDRDKQRDDHRGGRNDHR